MQSSRGYISSQNIQISHISVYSYKVYVHLNEKQKKMGDKTLSLLTARRENLVTCKQMSEGRLSQLGGGGETGSLRTSLSRKCLLIICVGVSACRQTTAREEGRGRQTTGRERHTGRWDSLVSLRREWNALGAEKVEARPKVTGCVRARRRSAAFTKEEFEFDWETQMGRKTGGESDRGREGGKAVTPRPPSSSSAALAAACSGEERLLKPSPRLHVWTQSLPLPC